MTRRHITAALCATIALQLFVLLGMVVNAATPLWTGREIRVRTIPVDPRSLFRGNYARLNYAFSTLPKDALGELTRHLRVGEVVYVRLQQGEENVYEFAGASLDRPAGGVFLRGRMTHNTPPYRVTYGLEAFFAPKDTAVKLEDALRSGGLAVVMVSETGKAALKAVIPHPAQD
jgi:uncharacterized membrane-anchored protein